MSIEVVKITIGSIQGTTNACRWRGSSNANDTQSQMVRKWPFLDHKAEGAALGQGFKVPDKYTTLKRAAQNPEICVVWHRKVWVRVRENNRNCFPGTKIRTWYTIPRMLYVFSSPSCQKCVRTGPRTFSVKYSTRNEQWQKKRLNHSQLIQTTLSKLSNQIRILISNITIFSRWWKLG